MKKDEIKQRDEEWKESVKTKYRDCIICGSKKHLQGAHLFGRAYRSTRWDVNNGVTLCRAHHIFWLRSHPIEFTWLLEKMFGKRKLKALFKKSGSKNIWE